MATKKQLTKPCHAMTRAQVKRDEVGQNDEAVSKTTRRVIKTTTELSDHQKYLVKQVHRHMGHISKEELIRVSKTGNFLPEVCQCIQDKFKCEECEVTTRPPVRRNIGVPRIFSFNRVLSIDTFFVTLGCLFVHIQCIIC